MEFEAEKDGVHQNIIFEGPVALPPGMELGGAYLYCVTEISLDEAVSAHAVEVSMAGESLPVGSPSLFTEPTSRVNINFSDEAGNLLYWLI